MNDNYNKLVDDTYYKTVIYNNGGTLSLKADTYEKFLDSLDKVKDKNMLMYHSPFDVEYARTYYNGYLTNEELQERQYEGRFWDVYLGAFYILVDNDTLVIVDANGVEGIYGRDCLPESLKGRHYYE